MFDTNQQVSVCPVLWSGACRNLRRAGPDDPLSLWDDRRPGKAERELVAVAELPGRPTATMVETAERFGATDRVVGQRGTYGGPGRGAIAVGRRVEYELGWDLDVG